ncbi:hypothetical protein GCM10010329_36840 [Streptomyces spiroverticillatus]|uniref:Uncharacterized protein n=1 Tax=Streptomyces finlayi TaxID=67296 RepID=A0A918WYQ9_9ACTN|nr:hypothetical protein [Streptomyces finlayi]GHA10687.1 hypothetical protein GCM10010329_36840 [Streptomyces spiroverticillatus]GHC95469.1 hypothetical protein GCM10010334_34770 [Streptomyces finlayi]
MAAPYADASDDLGFDWQAERRRLDGPRPLLWGLAGLFVVLTVLAALLLDLWFATGIGFGAVVCWAVVAWSGVRLRRQWSEELGVPAEALPVLARRMNQGRVPESPRARAAIAELARKSMRGTTLGKWVYPIAAVIMLVNAVMGGLSRDWGQVALWSGLACLQGLNWFLTRRRRRWARRILATTESDR